MSAFRWPLSHPLAVADPRGTGRTARSGDRLFTGVCSGYLDRNPEQSTVFTFVRQPSIPFRPPQNPHVPMIMVGCGTGMAPFRGFLQERADLKAAGVPVGESLLFFGFRDPGQDYLYPDELEEFEKLGIVQVETVRRGRRASRATDRTVSGQAEAWLADLRAEHRYLEDIWGGSA